MIELAHRKDPAHLAQAYIAPFAVFMGFLVVLQVISVTIGWDHPQAPWWRRDPAHLLYPIQSVVCLGILWHYRKSYEWGWSWRWMVPGVVFGLTGIGFWLLPTSLYEWLELEEKPGGLLGWLGVDARRDGFDPNLFENPVAMGVTVFFRFLRAAVVVAFVEEIFWRGFLMRFVCDWEGDYWKQPFGKPTLLSYAVVTGAFTLAHAPVDYAGAVIYGSLTWLLCIWGKSLAACILMHAVANFTMCVFIMQTGKFGLW